MFLLVRGHKGFKFRIYPSTKQQQRLLQWESALRFLWNLALEQRKLGRARPLRRYLSAFDQINELKALCAEVPFLADVPRNVCAQVLVELDKAWQRCFKRLNRAPRFKRKGSRDYLGLTEPHSRVWRLQKGTLRFPKLGPLRAVVHRPLEGTPKSCTIRRDRGITHLVADSDGQLVQNPKCLEAALKRLARAQRVVSRRKKGSKNRLKAVRRVSRLHRTIRRRRDHLLHSLSSAYANSHGTVVVERLQTANMLRNRPLARRIADAGWSRLVQLLRYKLAWNGGQLIEVPAAYSSQTCSACGAIDRESRHGERFSCTRCGYLDHADLNAAKVLKSRANRSALPVEGALPESTRRSRKVVVLRVPRRPPQSPALLGRG